MDEKLASGKQETGKEGPGVEPKQGSREGGSNTEWKSARKGGPVYVGRHTEDRVHYVRKHFILD